MANFNIIFSGILFCLLGFLLINNMIKSDCNQLKSIFYEDIISKKNIQIKCDILPDDEMKTTVMKKISDCLDKKDRLINEYQRSRP